MKYTEKDIQDIREEVEQGTPVRQIAMARGVSRQWVYGLIKAQNPSQEEREYWCYKCSESFSSKARYRVERCKICGSYEWANNPDSESNGIVGEGSTSASC